MIKGDKMMFVLFTTRQVDQCELNPNHQHGSKCVVLRQF